MKKASSFFVVALFAAVMSFVSVSAFDSVKRGDNGENVREIQQKLIDLGYLSGSADGSFGPQTEMAVSAFQSDNNLDATGIVGDATYKALMGVTLSEAGDSYALAHLDLEEYSENYYTDDKLIYSLFMAGQEAGRQLGYVTQVNNPEISFDSNTQTLGIVHFYFSYYAECSNESARNTLEAYTDELIFSFQNAFPNQTFEKMSINWKIPAIDEESLYSASYWCERVDGVLTKVSANGKIYSGKVGFIDNSGSENDDVTKSSGFFDTIKKGSSKNLSTKNDIAYDATLEYSTKGPVVFSSETAMSRFMKAVANDYEGTIEEMLNSGEAMVITNGTKCSILKTTISKCQVKLLEGSHAGETVWTVIEALKRK